MKPVSDQVMRQHATLLGQLAAPEIPRELPIQTGNTQINQKTDLEQMYP